MRKWMFAFLLLGVMGALAAQDCNTFFPFQEKTVMEYVSFDKKGKKEAVVQHRVAFVDNTDDGGIMARVETVIQDEKGEEVMKSDYEVTCKGEEISFDMISMLSPQMKQAFSGMEMTVTGDGLHLPAKLEVGQTLPDATTQIKAGTGGLDLVNMTLSIVDRKVEAKETITTEAGATYECYRIRYHMESKMMITKTFEIVEWFSEGIGMVRSETYDKKGKLESTTELQSYSKP